MTSSLFLLAEAAAHGGEHHEATLLGLGAEGWVYVGITIFFLIAIFKVKAHKQILSALDHVHRLGLIHRDVKPENLRLVPDASGEDRVVLMDFGFVGNGVAMYDLTQLARHVRDAYEELKAASSKKRKAPSRSTRSRSPKTSRASS